MNRKEHMKMKFKTDKEKVIWEVKKEMCKKDIFTLNKTELVERAVSITYDKVNNEIKEKLGIINKRLSK